MYTNPMRSSVVTRTTAQIVSAICTFLMIVTAINTTAKAKRRFSIATDRM